MNLYELVKQNQFRGLSCNLIRTFVKQLLGTLQILREARVVHCDLKPENILLAKSSASSFPGACSAVVHPLFCCGF